MKVNEIIFISSVYNIFKAYIPENVIISKFNICENKNVITLLIEMGV